MKRATHNRSKKIKSSAAVMTLAYHALIFVGGLSLVVMTQVIEPEYRAVAGPTVERARIPRPRLRPPTEASRASSARPRFERIEVKPKMNRDTPTIAVPAFKGLASSFAGAGTEGNDALGTIAFATPEFKIFNVRGQGEKLFLILDAGDHMLEDRMGGIPAYEIIKSELIRLVGELPPTAVFNVCVFGQGQTWTLFPTLVSASAANTARVGPWLTPLNAAATSAATGRYGIGTLGEGGVRWQDDFRRGAFAENAGVEERAYRPERWFSPAMVAMAQQADTVFLLTNTWGHQRDIANDPRRSRAEWLRTSDGKRWLKAIAESKELHKEENRRRKEQGEPPRVIAHGNWGLVAAYRPNTPRPPQPEFRYFTPRDFKQAFKVVRTEGRKKRTLKDPYSFNVIRFSPVDAEPNDREDQFKKLVGLCGGGYQTLAGLEAIQSYLDNE